MNNMFFFISLYLAEVTKVKYAQHVLTTKNTFAVHLILILSAYLLTLSVKFSNTTFNMLILLKFN